MQIFSPKIIFQSRQANFFFWFALNTQLELFRIILTLIWTTLWPGHKNWPHTMRLNFFDHRTLFWTPNRQFYSNCAHFWWVSSTLAIICDEIKQLDWPNHFEIVFIYFQKKEPKFFDRRSLFWWPNRQF